MADNYEVKKRISLDRSAIWVMRFSHTLRKSMGALGEHWSIKFRTQGHSVSRLDIEQKWARVLRAHVNSGGPRISKLDSASFRSLQPWWNELKAHRQAGFKCLLISLWAGLINSSNWKPILLREPWSTCFHRSRGIFRKLSMHTDEAELWHRPRHWQ